ncbi:hypothetical protein ScPMuIL_007866 [Solemya velum]
MAGRIIHPPVHVATSLRCVANQLRKLLPDVQVIDIELNEGSLSQTSREQINADAEILLADGVPVVTAIMQEENKLRWVQSTWAGVEKIIKRLNPEKPLPSFVLTRSGGASFGKIMADYVMGYIIAHERHLFDMKEDQSKRTWVGSSRREFRPISGLSIGILGIGDIGKEVARCCKSMGMTVWGMVTRQPPEDRKCDAIDFYRTTGDLPEILTNCDHVCNILPSTSSTAGLLSAESFFINIGRGDVTTEADIVEAISSEWISGAALDVFESEPLPESSKLWALPNVHITPHISGSCITELCAEDFAKNYHRYVNKEPLKCVFRWGNLY